MTFQIYRWFLLPVGLGLLRILSPLLPEKIRLLFADRKKNRESKLNLRAPCILVHAASGEIEYAKPVIRAIRQRWPHFQIVVSYFSPSAKKLHQGLDVAAIVPLPFDRPALVKAFLDQYSPSVVLIARSDLWPEFMFQCHQRGIHSVLFSATASASRPVVDFIGRSMRSFTLSQLSLISCVSEDDASVFRKLTDTPILVQGDTRYEQVLERLKNAKVLPVIKDLVAGKKIAVLGSTWPEDDEVFLAIASQEKRLRWIWAPHEIDDNKMTSLTQNLSAAGLQVQRFSEVQRWTSDVLLVDRVGVLAELYCWGDFAFVGGSFKSKVHSVMEPLAAGIPVVVGPCHGNNREAIDFQRVQLQPNFSAVEVIRNSDEGLAYVRQKIMSNNSSNTCEILRAEINRRSQTTPQLLAVIGLEKVTDIARAKSPPILSKN